jgi:hypothetical protein
MSYKNTGVYKVPEYKKNQQDERRSELNGGLADTDEELLKECHRTLAHAQVFISSREKMHEAGRGLYSELLSKLVKRLVC